MPRSASVPPRGRRRSPGTSSTCSPARTAYGAGDLLSYDVRADAWRGIQKPRTPYQYLTAAGDRLVAFDYEARRSEESASVLDPDTGRWTPLPPDPLGPVTDRWLVGTGAGLVVAGHSVVPDDRAPVVRVAALDETLTKWGAEWTTDVVGWAPQFVNGRLVWASDQTVDGGEVNGWGRSYDEGGVLDPTTGRTTPLPLPPRQRTGGLGTAVQTDRYVSVSDGLLDPASGSFLHVPDPPGGPRTPRRPSWVAPTPCWCGAGPRRVTRPTAAGPTATCSDPERGSTGRAQQGPRSSQTRTSESSHQSWTR